MQTIIILVGILLIIIAAFIFLFLKEDQKKFNLSFSREKAKNLTADDIKKSSVSTEHFVAGLSGLDFVNPELAAVKHEIHKKIIGMDDFINAIIINILCGGHVLVEGVPGLAKTKTIHTFADVMGMDFKRIQFTPDMLPADVLGVEIFNSKTREFETKRGPIVSNIVLADEINRATPKVQSALLESMQEKQISIGGKTTKLPEPFFVLATQNPLEQEGTYPLPEAQVDRFLFKILVTYPNRVQEKQVLQAIEEESSIKVKKILSHSKFAAMQKGIDKVVMSDDVKDYITRLVEKTRQPHPYLVYGASPRGSIGLMTAAKAVAFVEDRDYVTHEDVQRVTLAVLRHRIVLNYDAKIEGMNEDKLLLELVGDVTLM